MANGIELAPLVVDIQANLNDYNKGIDEADRKGTALEKQMKELNSESKLTESSFKLAGAGAELLGNKTGILANKQNELTEKLKLQSRAVDITKEAYGKAEKSMQEYSSKSKKLEEQLKDVNREQEIAKRTYGANSKEVKILENKINSLNKEYKENESTVTKAKEELDDYKIKLNDVQIELLQTKKALNDTNKEMKNTKISNLNDKLEKTSNKLQGVGSSLTNYCTIPMLGAGIASAKLASDLTENVNKTDVVFKDNSETVKEWSKTSLERMGMCQSSALDMASKFGDMGSSMGLSSKSTLDYSMNLTQLSADMASFKNISIDRANEALTGIYTGETEALKSQGIVMTQANLQAFAENQGIKEKVQNMSQAEQVQLRYNYVMDKTKDAQGDFARTNDQAANATRTFWEATKELGATIGNDLLPILTPLINKANEAIKSFSNMDEGTRGLIVKAGLFTIAAGPVLSIVGKGVGLLTTLTPLITGAGAATAGAGVAAGGATVTLGALSAVALPLVGVLAAVAGGAYLIAKDTEVMNSSCLKSKEELGGVGNVLLSLRGGYALTTDQMDKMNIKHKDWSDKISPETQKALTDVSDRVATLNFELEQSNGLKGVITKPQIESFKKRTDDLFNETIKKIKSRAPETQKEMAKSFKADDGQLDKDEKKLMEFFNKSQNKQIKEVEEYRKEKNKILEKAAKEHRDLTKDEMQKVQDLVMKAGEVNMNNTVKNNQELIAAQADFNARMKNLDMNGLSSLLSEKAKARDKEIGSIKLNYDKQIEELKLYRPKMNKEEQKSCDERIKKLEKLKTDSIGKEREKYKGFLDEAKKKYPEIASFIDETNGEMLTEKQKTNIREFGDYAKHLDGLNKVTKSGYYKIKNATGEGMHNCYVEVNESTGKITGVWDNGQQHVYGNPIKATEDIKEELKNGAVFQPIVDSYDGKNTEIANNPINPQVKHNSGLFNWVQDLWDNQLSYIAEHPLEAFTNFITRNNGETPHHNFNGIDYVPYDGYITRLHKGERIMTADENNKYNNDSESSSTTINFNGNYGFKDRNDIDYFMNQAALKLRGAR